MPKERQNKIQEKTNLIELNITLRPTVVIRPKSREAIKKVASCPEQSAGAIALVFRQCKENLH